jgi:cytochrome o ubiquinol oxidase subunit III
MTHPGTVLHESYPDTHHDVYSKTIFGFWTFLLTDFVLFATFFAAYAVLHDNTYGGPSGREIFRLSFTMVQTVILLTCSFISGLAGAAAHRKNKNWTIVLFGITFLLGIAFMWMEIADFSRLINAGNSWKKSAFLSAYFSLLGTHGIHMVLAILWIIVLIPPVFREGITLPSIRRLTCLRMFWQFLNVVWVFIFTIVYVMGGKWYD